MAMIAEFRHLSDERWLNLMIDDLNGAYSGPLKLPTFPRSEIQSQFVGSSGADSLREAFYFYSFLKQHASKLGKPLKADSQILDFGCGWGRYLRFFWKDVEISGIHGVDVDPSIIELCKATGVPGKLETIEPLGQLPFADSSFDTIMAFSVFTHLPENVHLHWMKEFKRVARPGCIVAMTLEPRRFLEFVAGLKDKQPESGWHAGLQRFSEFAGEALVEFDQGKMVYLPTGGGDYRAADVYGDAVCPLPFIRSVWEPEFKVIEYVDNPKRFWQAAIALQKAGVLR